MTRKAAFAEIKMYHDTSADGRKYWVVVRWATHYGPPAWTIESRSAAEKALQEYGEEEVRIEREER